MKALRLLRRAWKSSPATSSASWAETPLVETHEYRRMDRATLENRSRAMAHTVYLGDGLIMCRILGRYKLYVPATDIGFGAHVMMEGMWEGWLNVVVSRLVKPGMTVVDVGANHGYYTLFLGGLVGLEGRVIALEPHPATAALLRRSVYVNGMDSRTRIVEAAAVDVTDQTLHFYADPAEPKNARVVGGELAEHPSVTSVQATTLDAILADTPRVDFIKIDVEGAEEAALAGAMRIIARDKPDILLEFNSLRCQDPAGALDRLEAIYGEIFIINFRSELEHADRAALLDPNHIEDWSLLLTTRRGDDLPIPLT